MKTYNTNFSKKLTVLSLASCLLSALAPASTVWAVPPITIRASVSSTGEEGNGSSSGSAISANGRFVTFHSSASNLVSGDNNGVSDNNGLQDVFVHDLKTGVTQLLTKAIGPARFANGRFVAFTSDANNLVYGDNNGVTDIFVHDLKTGVTQRVSVDSDGVEGNGSSGSPAISANGRFVAFVSSASNLVAGDNNGWDDIFVRDLKSGVTQRVSVDSAGIEGNGPLGTTNYYYPGSGNPSISANGRFVAFESTFNNLVTGDNNGLGDIFVRDLKTGVTQRVSVDSSGAEASVSGYDPGDYCAGAWFSIYSGSPSISADGRFVAFESTACNLVEGDTNTGFYAVGNDYPGTDIFMHDLKTDETKLVSVDSSGVGFQGYGPSYDPSISSNGRFVAFTSFYGNAFNLLYFFTTNVVVHDLKTGVTQIVSVDPEAGNNYYWGSINPSISANGRFISFESDSSNLVPGDNNGGASGYGIYDVFVSRMW